MQNSDRARFTLNGAAVDVEVAPGESLLSVLRERLGVFSAKDGCAPQGQCGCCTVLVDGQARVACVTPVDRVADRAVTTIEGLDPDERTALTEAFCATGGSQCGFCTPGILVRVAALRATGRSTRADLDRALAAHLCRCTGWQTIYEAVAAVGSPSDARDLDAAGRRADIEGRSHQVVSVDVPLGAGGFADDTAPRDALVAVPRAPGSDAEATTAVGVDWVVAESLPAARAHAAKVQGRRSTVPALPPLALPELPPGGVRLATGWVEPAYLEPDASWCAPGAEPASPLANGGAFGGKVRSPVTDAARDLADRLGRPVRVVLAREDVVRLGPKRPPIAASAVLHGTTVRISGVVAGGVEPFERPAPWPYAIDEVASWVSAGLPGPPTDATPRMVGLAERAVLLEGALDAAGVDRAALVIDDRARSVLLDTCAPSADGGVAGARVHLDDARGTITGVEVRVAAGAVLDAVTLRSYCIGAAHMALGWVLAEGIAVDPETGEVLDLTIRSFGIVRAKDMPPVDVEIVDDHRVPVCGSDAVFAAVAAASWNAVTDAEARRPDSFPARSTRAAGALRR
jgi:xanthine dehydrogenase small subunit